MSTKTVRTVADIAIFVTILPSLLVIAF